MSLWEIKVDEIEQVKRLIAFEARVKAAFEAGEVKGPVHLSGGNEQQLVEVFRDISRCDWIFSNWRSHYHALLHGIPEDFLYAEILAGRSLSFNSAPHKFYTSAIVGGCLPIAVGVAAAIKRKGGTERVWCFVGDMAASIGSFTDATAYAHYNDLPVRFVIEDNGMSTNTPSKEAWGAKAWGRFDCENKGTIYKYERTVPHYGVGRVKHL